VSRDLDGPAEHIRIGTEGSHPDTMRENNRAPVPWSPQRIVKGPPESGLGPQHLEMVGGDGSATEFHWLTLTGKREGPEGDAAHRLQCRNSLGGHVNQAFVVIPLGPGYHQAVPLPIRQVPQQHAMHHRKHGCGSADSQRESPDRDERESRRS
jgi:hypothetical protein